MYNSLLPWLLIYTDILNDLCRIPVLNWDLYTRFD